MNCMPMDSIIEVFYYLNNKLTTMKCDLKRLETLLYRMALTYFDNTNRVSVTDRRTDRTAFSNSKL